MTTPLLNRDVLNNVTPDIVADVLRKMGMGDLFGAQFVQQRRHIPGGVLSPYLAATNWGIGTAYPQRANTILRAYNRLATGTEGEMTVDGHDAVVTTTNHIGIAPNGDIVTLAADVITDMDVVYIAERGDVIDLTLPVGNVSANVLTLPASVTKAGAILLLEAEILSGGTTGAKIIQGPSASAASTGNARLDLSKQNVKFASADAATRAHVKLLVGPTADLTGFLTALAAYI